MPTTEHVRFLAPTYKKHSVASLQDVKLILENVSVELLLSFTRSIYPFVNRVFSVLYFFVSYLKKSFVLF